MAPRLMSVSIAVCPGRTENNGADASAVTAHGPPCTAASSSARSMRTLTACSNPMRSGKGSIDKQIQPVARSEHHATILSLERFGGLAVDGHDDDAMAIDAQQKST